MRFLWINVCAEKCEKRAGVIIIQGGRFSVSFVGYDKR